MATPRRWEHGDGHVPWAYAPAAAVADVLAGRMSLLDYRALCDGLFSAAGDVMPPAKSDLQDGDSLLCACARPGSPVRAHPCHLELLAPHLVRAGWDVVLHGRQLTLGTWGGVPDMVDAKTVQRVSPEDYGWPAGAAMTHATCPRCGWHRRAYLPLCPACIELLVEVHRWGLRGGMPRDAWTLAADAAWRASQDSRPGWRLRRDAAGPVVAMGWRPGETGAAR